MSPGDKFHAMLGIHALLALVRCPSYPWTDSRIVHLFKVWSSRTELVKRPSASLILDDAPSTELC